MSGFKSEMGEMSVEPLTYTPYLLTNNKPAQLLTPTQLGTDEFLTGHDVDV